MPSLLGPQDASFAQSTLANAQKVQLHLELQLLEAPRNGEPRQTVVTLQHWTGQVITHLQLEKQKGRWVIVSERERLVHESIPFQGISVGTAQ